MMTVHTPVMMQEVIEAFRNIPSSSVVVDCTFGGGGHANALLMTYPDFMIIGCDRSIEAVTGGQELVKQYNGRLQLYHRRMPYHVTQVLSIETPMGFLVDCGISSDQLLEVRGLSFQDCDAPLDMRMGLNTSCYTTAAEFLNKAPLKELERVFYKYGQDGASGKIAIKIAMKRKTHPLKKVRDLKQLIISDVPPYHHHKVLAKYFQSIRMFINDEMQDLEDTLSILLEYMEKYPNIVIVFITFQSLEEKLIGQFIKQLRYRGKVQHYLSSTTTEEINLNPRSRSGRFHVITSFMPKNKTKS